MTRSACVRERLGAASKESLRRGMRPLARFCVARATASILLVAACGVLWSQDMYSELWGKDGEKWDVAGRLPDFSYAGYRFGEQPIPTIPVKANVKTFGAKGDGTTDDTKAFQDALAKTSGGAILVPAGKYVIADFLVISKSETVLRGEGPDKTTLYFPKYLNDVKPNWGATTTGQKTSNYSWQGGFVEIRGSAARKSLGKLTAPAKRGEFVVTVEKNVSAKPGDLVEISMKDNPDNSLAKYLYNNQTEDVGKLNGRTSTSFISRVKMTDGARITLERALRTDVDPKWGAEVFTYEPRLTESGIEELCFEFPNPDYPGEFKELGHNPCVIYGASHCWIRNVRVLNGESGPYVNGTFCTVSGIALDSTRKPDKTGVVGHHGISCYGDDNRVEDFTFSVKYVHDLSVEHSAGNVFRRGRGPDLCFDHHKRAPHANLFTDLDIGEGKRMYRCGGGAELGPNCASWGTFWNLKAKQAQKLWAERFGTDLLTFVGVESKEKSVLDPKGKWWETIPPTLLSPQDLYEAQLNRRLKRPAVAEKKADSKTDETAKVATPPPVTVPDGLQAEWQGKLVARIEAAAKARKPLKGLVNVGGKSAAYPLVGADEKELRVEINGNAMPVRWSWLKPPDLVALAKSLAKEDDAESQLILAVFLLADGRIEHGEQALARAALLDADAVTKVRGALKTSEP